MAKKTAENSKPRVRKAAAAKTPTAIETFKDATPVNEAPMNGLEEEIRRRAYELYLQRGGVPGDSNRDWLIAEQEVRSRQMEHVH